MWPICCPETSVQNYHSTIRNIPEEHRSHVHRSLYSSSQLHCFIQTLPYALFIACSVFGVSDFWRFRCVHSSGDYLCLYWVLLICIFMWYSQMPKRRFKEIFLRPVVLKRCVLKFEQSNAYESHSSARLIFNSELSTSEWSNSGFGLINPGKRHQCIQ